MREENGHEASLTGPCKQFSAFGCSISVSISVSIFAAGALSVVAARLGGR